MSVQAMSWVIDHAPQGGSELLVLLMIANHTRADGTGAFPSMPLLARECRMSTRQVIRIVHRLAAGGALRVEAGAGPKGTHLLAVVMAEGAPAVAPTPDILSGDNLSGGVTFSAPTPDIAMSDKPSLEPSVPLFLTEEGGPAPPARPRPVPKPVPLPIPAHPAVAAYRRGTRLNPLPAVRAAIEEAVPLGDDDALVRWSTAVGEWAARGFNPRNVEGMLEWFREGVPERRPRPAPPAPSKRVETKAEYFRRRREEMRDASLGARDRGGHLGDGEQPALPDYRGGRPAGGHLAAGVG